MDRWIYWPHKPYWLVKIFSGHETTESFAQHGAKIWISPPAAGGCGEPLPITELGLWAGLNYAPTG